MLVQAGIAALSVLMVATPGSGFVARASVASNGHQGNGPVVSAAALNPGASELSASRQWTSSNGRYVAFPSSATNLVAADTNGIEDIFRHDNVTGTTVRVDLANDGSQVPVQHYVAMGSISGNGRRVAFATTAALVPQDVNGTWDVYVRDVDAGTTTLASVLPGGALVGADPATFGFGAHYGSLSADGSRIAFAVGQLPGGPDPSQSVYVRNLTTATTTFVDAPSNTSDLQLSANGQHLLERGECWGVGPCQGPITSVVDFGGPSYPAEVLDGGTVQHYLALSATGRYLLEQVDHNGGSPPGPVADGLYRYDRSTRTRVVITTERIRGAAMSSDGRVATFTATSAVIPTDTNKAADVFAFDIDAGVIDQVSVNAYGAEGDNTSALASVNANGRVVSYVSKASNLVPDDTNRVSDLFVASVGKPAITGLSPIRGAPGGHATVLVEGAFLLSGATASFGRGITVDSVAPGPHGALLARITIAPNATPGRRQVTVTNPGPVAQTKAVCASCFTVAP